MTSSRIAGCGHYVPEHIRTNDDISEMVETSDEWIRSRTGIVERRIAHISQASSDLAVKASEMALADANLSPKDIDMIIVGTVTPDRMMPSTAMYVQTKLGCRNTIPGFDLSAACSGFLFGMTIGDQFIRSGMYKNVLVIGVEVLSRKVNWSDRGTCILFGDGAGAMVLSAADDDCDRRIVSSHMYGNGDLADTLSMPAGGSREPITHERITQKRQKIQMDGGAIYKFAVRSFESAIKTAMEENDLTPDDVDIAIPHQANMRILQGAAARCGIPVEKFYTNLQKYGNTSAASVPIAFSEAKQEGLLRPGHRIIMCALGAGITWGSSLIRW